MGTVREGGLSEDGSEDALRTVCGGRVGTVGGARTVCGWQGGWGACGWLGGYGCVGEVGPRWFVGLRDWQGTAREGGCGCCGGARTLDGRVGGEQGLWTAVGPVVWVRWGSEDSPWMAVSTTGTVCGWYRVGEMGKDGVWTVGFAR